MRLTIRACGSETRQRELDERERREHVRLVHAPQLLDGVSRQERQRARAEHAGVVDEEVDRLAGRLHEPAAMVGIGDVARDRDHAGEPGDRILERLRPARVDGELPTALGQSAGEREPEAARCSGDDPSHTRHPQESCRLPIARLPAEGFTGDPLVRRSSPLHLSSSTDQLLLESTS